MTDRSQVLALRRTWVVLLMLLFLAASCSENPSDSPLRPTEPSHTIDYCPPGVTCYPLTYDMYSTLYMDIQAINHEADPLCADAKNAILEAFSTNQIGYWNKEDYSHAYGHYAFTEHETWRITLSSGNWTDFNATEERYKTLIHEGAHKASNEYRNEPYDWGESNGQAAYLETLCYPIGQ